MLKSLHLLNFQCHDHKIVELERITVFTGPSDKGKSAFVRSLRWASLNTPSGDGFIKDGEDHCVVSMRIDSHKILRKRGKGLNTYKLDGKVYKALGRGKVPPDVSKILNVSELNFSAQLSPPFWLTLSPGQVSRELNAIVDLGVIDSSLARIAQEVRKAKLTVEVSQDRLQAARERRKTLSHVPEMERELRELEAQESSILSKGSSITQARRSLQEAEELQSRLDRSSCAMLGALKGIRGLETLQGKLEKLSSRVQKYSSLLGQAEKLEAKCATLQTQLGIASSTLTAALGKSCPLCGAPTSKQSSSPTSTSL